MHKMYKFTTFIKLDETSLHVNYGENDSVNREIASAGHVTRMHAHMYKFRNGAV